MKAILAALLIAVSSALGNAEFYQYVMPSRSQMVYDLNEAIMERNAATSAVVPSSATIWALIHPRQSL